jgi:hypothetical protein
LFFTQGLTLLIQLALNLNPPISIS